MVQGRHLLIQRATCIRAYTRFLALRLKSSCLRVMTLVGADRTYMFDAANGCSLLLSDSLQNQPCNDYLLLTRIKLSVVIRKLVRVGCDERFNEFPRKRRPGFAANEFARSRSINCSGGEDILGRREAKQYRQRMERCNGELALKS